MITKDVRDTLYKEATEALAGFRIAAGLAQAQVLQYHCNSRTLAMQLEAVCTDYASMLGFIQRGGNDPKRESMQRQIAKRALDILDATHREIRTEAWSDDYARACKETRHIALTPESLHTAIQQDLDDEERYAMQDRLFNRLWTMEQLSPQQAATVYDFILSQRPNVQRHFVAGILMAMWEYFDIQKLQLLQMFMQEDNLGVRTQATLAYILVHLRHRGRLALYHDELMPVSSPYIKEEMRIAQHFLFMQKNCLKIYEQLAKNIQRHMSEHRDEDERQEILHQVMQDRADLNPRTFVIAYGKPFFHHMSSWWMPYEKDRPMCREALKQTEDRSLLKIHDFLLRHCCDVDMYAIIQMLGMKGLGIKTSMFGSPDEEMTQEMAEAEELTPTTTYSLLTQNIYRFFYYAKWCRNYPNPFEADVYLPDVPSLAPYFDTESLVRLHAMLMRTNDFNTALRCARDITASRGSDAQMLMDCGLCHQELGNHSAALQSYRQAELLVGDDIWLLTQMKQCYTQLNYHNEALDCLKRLEELGQTDYSSLLLEKARCLLSLNAYEEALQCFFEMKYRHMNEPEATRGIILCAFRSRQYQKARQYAQQFLESGTEPTHADYIVAGHIEWADGNWQKALEHYQEAIRHFISDNPEKKNIGDEWKFFEKDRHMLQEHGISQADIMLMYDLLSGVN